MGSKRRLRNQQLEQAVAQLRQTLDAAACNLKLFLESFERSYLREAVDSYQQLQWVILAQREWARTHRRAELDAGWWVIPSQAKTLYELFSPDGGCVGTLAMD